MIILWFVHYLLMTCTITCSLLSHYLLITCRWVVHVFMTSSLLDPDLFFTCWWLIHDLFMTLFTSLEVLHFSCLPSSKFIKSNKLNWLAGLSLAQLSPSLFWLLQRKIWRRTIEPNTCRFFNTGTRLKCGDLDFKLPRLLN